MARLFSDGYESGHLRLYTVTGTPTVVDAQGVPPLFPNAGLALYNGTGGTVVYALPSGGLRQLWVSFRWQACDNSAAHLVSQTVIRFWHGAVELAKIYTDADGDLWLTDNAATATDLDLGTSEHHARRYAIFLDTENGTLQFRPEGFANAGAEVSVVLPDRSVINSLSLESAGYYDDLVIDDTSCPRDRIIAGLAVDNYGDREQWSNSGAGEEYLDIDEVPPDHADYVSTDATGRMFVVRAEDASADMVTIQALRLILSPELAGTGDQVVDSVRPLVWSQVTTWEAGDMATAVEGPITVTTAGGTDLILETDPNTGEAWDADSVTAIQVGAVAELSTGPGSIEDAFLWLEADWIDPITDAELLWDTWIDLSNGLQNRRDPQINHYDASTPAYYAGIVNGHPVVRFGAGDGLRFYNLEHDPSEWTWIFAFEPDSIIEGWDYLLGTETLILAHQISAGKVGIRDADNTWKEVADSATGWQILTFRLSVKNGVQVYRDGTLVSTQGPTYKKTSIEGAPVCIGSNYDHSAAYCPMDLFGVFGASRALEDWELNNLHTYFGAKLGITVSAL